MGEGQSRETPKEPDRLAKAVIEKKKEVVVDERMLTVKKWNLHTSLSMMGTLGGILRDVVAKVGPKMDVASLLQRDIGQYLVEHEGNLVKILAGTIASENFKDLSEAEAWVKELGAGDALRLFAIIVKQNIRPLVEAVGEIAKEVGVKVKANADAAQKGLRPLTS